MRTEPKAWYRTVQYEYVYRYTPNTYTHTHTQWGKKIIWSPADFVRLPTDKEMISQ